MALAASWTRDASSSSGGRKGTARGIEASRSSAEQGVGKASCPVSLTNAITVGDGSNLTWRARRSVLISNSHIVDGCCTFERQRCCPKNDGDYRWSEQRRKKITWFLTKCRGRRNKANLHFCTWCSWREYFAAVGWAWTPDIPCCHRRRKRQRIG